MRYLYELGSSYANPEVRKALQHYYGVLTSKEPAWYRVAKRIEVKIEGSLEDLWKLHNEKSKEMMELRNVKLDWVESRPPASPNYLDLKAEIAKRMLKSCRFCEWKCQLDRTQRRGVCRLDYRSRVSSFFHHFGEEPPLVGSTGSGTIFFTGCNFRCVFCQNWDISQNAYNGMETDPKTLASIIKVLAGDRCLNINLVGGEPTPNLHTILSALTQVDINIPILWNSNMYMSEETMKLISDIIDIWLPDFKYGNDECALRLSAIRNYTFVVKRNHKWAGEMGDMIIRHLVLPNHLECCTIPILDWIAENLPGRLVNIMAQYRPEYLVARYPEKFPEISRRPYLSEMERAYNYAKSKGIIYEPVS